MCRRRAPERRGSLEPETSRYEQSELLPHFKQLQTPPRHAFSPASFEYFIPERSSFELLPTCSRILPSPGAVMPVCVLKRMNFVPSRALVTRAAGLCNIK